MTVTLANLTTSSVALVSGTTAHTMLTLPAGASINLNLSPAFVTFWNTNQPSYFSQNLYPVSTNSSWSIQFFSTSPYALCSPGLESVNLTFTNSPVLVTFGDWSWQSSYLLNGLGYGTELALGFAVFLAILKAVRPPKFPTMFE